MVGYRGALGAAKGKKLYTPCVRQHTLFFKTMFRTKQKIDIPLFF